MLVAQGVETRLGSAMKQAIELHRGAPVAAIIVVTDGANNAGLDPQAALASARDAKIPIFPVGLGSATMPVNVRVSDLVAPSRVHQRDAYTIVGYLQSYGLNGRSVTVELLEMDDAGPGTGQLVDSQRIELGDDGHVVAAKFELKNEDPGRRTYQLRVRAPDDDRNGRDDLQTVEVEVVGRRSRVLLFAGGPTREYRFVRNLLWRDGDVQVDVLLQGAPAGASQDADRIVDQFPLGKDQMMAYDALIAFDPDWTSLDDRQLSLLEDWVAESGGGLVGIAGPIFTDRWMRRPAAETIRNLFPVQFYRHVSLFDDGPEGAETALPLELTRAGSDAEFLWLGSSRDESESAWAAFPGVYSHWPVKAAKPGATVYAHCAGGETGSRPGRPVYMAEHFYGSGRVFFLGSGEMWRLRILDDAYLEMFYTKLVRHVSQGRFLGGASPGALLVERDRYILGETVIVRVRTDDKEHESAAPIEVQGDAPGRPDRSGSHGTEPSPAGRFLGPVHSGPGGSVPGRLANARPATPRGVTPPASQGARSGTRPAAAE